MQTKTECVKVTDIKFITTPSGMITCLLVLSQPVKIEIGKDSMTYEVLRLNTMDEISEFNINVGQILFVEFSFKTIHDIQMKYLKSSVSMRPIAVPHSCNRCDSHVTVYQGIHSCSGHFCPAKSRISLKLLFIQACDKSPHGHEFAEFDKYLDSFPLYDGSAHITNIIDFTKIFKSLGNINIQGRADLLEKNGMSSMMEFETWFYEKLMSKHYMIYLSDFWDLLPMSRDLFGLELLFSSLNPTSENFSNQLTELPIDDETRIDFVSNIHHIQSLFAELTC